MTRRRGWPLRIAAFTGWYLVQWWRSSLVMSALILRPSIPIRPGIVRVPSASRSEAELTLISALITITPGTLTIAIDREAAELYVHGAVVESPEVFTAEIQDMETRMLHALRPRGIAPRPRTPERPPEGRA